MTFWKKGSGVIVRDGRLVTCQRCPCNNKIHIIAQHITNADNPEWNLRPYRFSGIPGGVWRLRDVGECFYEGTCGGGAGCVGTIYGSGVIGDNGELIGLPDVFVSKYDYNGYMTLEEGVINGRGQPEWPCGDNGGEGSEGEGSEGEDDDDYYYDPNQQPYEY